MRHTPNLTPHRRLTLIPIGINSLNAEGCATRPLTLSLAVALTLDLTLTLTLAPTVLTMEPKLEDLITEYFRRYDTAGNGVKATPSLMIVVVRWR